MDMHLHLKGADMASRCVWVLVLTYHLTWLRDQRYTFHLALVCTLFTNWQTPRHLLINHAEHSGEPLFQRWALFQSSSFGPSVSQSPSQGVTWKTSGCSPTRPWKGLSRAFLALREISVSLSCSHLHRGPLVSATTLLSSGGVSLTLPSPTTLDLWPRPPFFTPESLKDLNSFQMCPLHSEIILCLDCVLSGAGVTCDLCPLHVGQTACSSVWGLQHKPDVRSPLTQPGDYPSLPFRPVSLS